MSDYTPTTKQIRDGFAFDPQYEEYDERDGQAFDRWYAAEIRAAKAEALRESVRDAVIIPDITGHKVKAVFTEDLLNLADQIESDNA